MAYKTPSVEKFIAGDDTYANTISDLRANYGLTREATRTNKDNLRADFNTLRSRMRQQQSQDNRSLDSDFAARGMLGSGLELDASTKLDQNYNNQFTDAQQSRNRNLSQLDMDLSAARTLRDQQFQDARLNAIRRRAEKYGIR